MKCPRCQQAKPAQAFYGPCPQCVTELRQITPPPPDPNFGIRERTDGREYPAYIGPWFTPRQMTLFGACSEATIDKVLYGWRGSCSCGWTGGTVDVKWMARDELHAHLRDAMLKVPTEGADT